MVETYLRNICITHNNYTHNDLMFYISYECTYIILSKEVAPSTGTPHLQIYIQLPRQIRWSTLKKRLPHNASFYAAKGTWQQNKTYILKSKPEYVYEEGEPRGPGSKEDQKKIHKLIQENGSLSDLTFEEITVGVINSYEKIQKYCPNRGDRKARGRKA